METDHTGSIRDDLLSCEASLQAALARAGARQAGAYYTARDVAAYMAQRTILPFLLQAVQQGCPTFRPWDLLRADPERYLHPCRRDDADLKRQIAEVESIRDLITLNLDLPRFALDALARMSSEELRAFRHALKGLRILDPTCGSGAFLLAALELLRPLYQACLPGVPPLRNLYGVDLMPEAVELCSLRLQLEAGDSTDPPNLRTGNALAGFDWKAEFPDVPGFDIILGNPPYLELREIDYAPGGFRTNSVHAMCVERSLQLLQPRGCISMIVPMALVSTRRMEPLQALLEAGRDVWYANHSWRPAKLFPNVNRALTIFTAIPSEQPHTFSTGYRKWTARTRPELMARTRYTEVPRNRPSFWVPKLSCDLERPLLDKLLRIPTTLSDFMAESTHRIYYRTTGGLYWKVFTDFPPAFTLNGAPARSSRQAHFSVARQEWLLPAIAALSSDLFWWWYTVTTNCRDLNPHDLRTFPLPESLLADPQIATLGRAYLDDLVRHSAPQPRRQRQTGFTETQSFNIRKSKPIITEIDRALASHYGLTPSELDHVTNYESGFRLGGGAG